MSQENQTSKPEQNTTPVIVWEQKMDRTQEKGSKVISIDAYRRHGSDSVETEATVTIRDLSQSSSGEPIRLIMVSSGFGQKPSRSSSTLLSMAA